MPKLNCKIQLLQHPSVFHTDNRASPIAHGFWKPLLQSSVKVSENVLHYYCISSISHNVHIVVQRGQCSNNPDNFWEHTQTDASFNNRPNKQKLCADIYFQNASNITSNIIIIHKQHIHMHKDHVLTVSVWHVHLQKY